LQSGALDQPVADQTGLAGRFDLRLTWTPGEMHSSAESADALPDIFTAIQEELELKLVSTKAPVDVLVIDHVERTSSKLRGYPVWRRSELLRVIDWIGWLFWGNLGI
jgi:uncharacterized protein (TIGR03435 family)